MVSADPLGGECVTTALLTVSSSCRSRPFTVIGRISVLLMDLSASRVYVFMRPPLYRSGSTRGLWVVSAVRRAVWKIRTALPITAATAELMGKYRGAK